MGTLYSIQASFDYKIKLYTLASQDIYTPSIHAELTRQHILQIAQLDAIIAIAHNSDVTAAPIIVP